ncbi:MAG: metallophosphoesterase [Thiomargarita sp.]|nr:metallophosphoesterase [Thiomargarita sp.]
MTFERIVVFGDLHGDLDITLASMSEKGLVSYDRDWEQAITLINACVNDTIASTLEAMVIPQEKPVRMIFLGDFLDRYDFGYHIIQFLDKIRWENFGIYPIFLMGNHDLMNVHFFLNPYEISDLYKGCGHAKEDIAAYVAGMGLSKSLTSFKTLHAKEIIQKQKEFYKTGVLTYQDDTYRIQHQYPTDLSLLADIQLAEEDHYTQYYNQVITILGGDKAQILQAGTLNNLHELGTHLSKQLRSFSIQNNHRNWWSLAIDPNAVSDSYNAEISNFNLFQERDGYIIPIDWRVISFVWRQHYGDFFRQIRLLHHEDTTVFVHGGISPLSMMDPLMFGNLYDLRFEYFKSLDSSNQEGLSLDNVINRSNRLMAQILENALNDYSFKRMTGLEVIDQIGVWRGSVRGFPVFGGATWSDFDYLHDNIKQHDNIKTLYQKFQENTGISRIVCGHTHFADTNTAVRFKGMHELKEIGLEYICIDNSCSKAYRVESVLNGIEINQDNQIVGEGTFTSYKW